MRGPATSYETVEVENCLHCPARDGTYCRLLSRHVDWNHVNDWIPAPKDCPARGPGYASIATGIKVSWPYDEGDE